MKIQILILLILAMFLVHQAKSVPATPERGTMGQQAI